MVKQDISWKTVSLKKIDSGADGTFRLSPHPPQPPPPASFETLLRTEPGCYLKDGFTAVVLCRVEHMTLSL